MQFPSKIGLAGGERLVTNLLITEEVLTCDLMGCNIIIRLLNNYSVGGSSLLGC